MTRVEELGLAVGAVVAAFLLGHLTANERAPITAADLRQPLERACLSNEAVKAEIEQMLPTAGPDQYGLVGDVYTIVGPRKITAEDMRHVLRDVVDHCR